MSNKVISSEEDVLEFLNLLSEILNNPSFDIDCDLDILMKKKAESPVDPYTTANTLLSLDFDRQDVFEHLKSLKSNEYFETILDDRDASLPPFFAFIRCIRQRETYIKVKVRDRRNGKVFCVSFHFARYPITKQLPYTKCDNWEEANHER